MADKPRLSDDLRTALKSVVDTFDREDQIVRERQVRQWRRYKYIWELSLES